MTSTEIILLKHILQNHPKVVEIKEGDGNQGMIGEVYITTNEDPDDNDSSTFGIDLLDTLGVDWMGNDCEGCYNEYVVR